MNTQTNKVNSKIHSPRPIRRNREKYTEKISNSLGEASSSNMLINFKTLSTKFKIELDNFEVNSGMDDFNLQSLKSEIEREEVNNEILGILNQDFYDNFEDEKESEELVNLCELFPMKFGGGSERNKELSSINSTNYNMSLNMRYPPRVSNTPEKKETYFI